MFKRQTGRGRGERIDELYELCLIVPKKNQKLFIKKILKINNSDQSRLVSHSLIGHDLIKVFNKLSGSLGQLMIQEIFITRTAFIFFSVLFYNSNDKILKKLVLQKMSELAKDFDDYEFIFLNSNDENLKKLFLQKMSKLVEYSYEYADNMPDDKKLEALHFKNYVESDRWKFIFLNSDDEVLKQLAVKEFLGSDK